MRLSCLSEYFDACRTGYLVSRILSSTFRRPWGLPARVVPAFYRKRFILSQASNPLQRPRRVLLSSSSRRRTDKWPVELLPWGFLPLQRYHSANRLSSGSTRTPSLFDLSQVLEGFILAERCKLVSSCCRSWGSSPSELFPADKLSQARRLAIPSRCSVRRPVVEGRTLRGLRKSAIRVPTQEYCILRQADALLGFQSLSRRSCAPVWIRLSTSHPLLAFTSTPYGTFSKSAFSVFLPGAPGISRSLERQPS